jgi:hypothetical protein
MEGVFYMAMSLNEDDKQWILEQLKASQEFTDRLIKDIHTDLDGKIEGLRQEMRDGFEQVSARLEAVEVQWKIVRDWGRGIDNRTIREGRILAKHRLRLNTLDARLSRVERSK